MTTTPDPASHLLLSKPLFADATAFAADLGRLAALSRAILDGDGDADELNDQAWEALRDAPRRALSGVQSGELPIAALSVLAGLTAVVHPQDYAMLPFWNMALEISVSHEEGTNEDSLLTPAELEMIAELEAEGNREIAQRLREDFEKYAREELEREKAQQKALEEKVAEEVARLSPEEGARFLAIYDEVSRSSDAMRGGRMRSPRGKQPKASPELVAWAERTGPLAARGSTLNEIADLRPMLWVNRGCGVAWEALCMAIDAIGAASFAGLERLHALASKHPGSPSVLWLDEIACRAARETPRAARDAEALDGVLSSSHYGKNASSLAICATLGRGLFEEQGTRLHDAWLRLAAVPRVHERIERLGEDMPESERARIRKAARKGDPVAKMLQHLEKGSERMASAERADADAWGPFDGVAGFPPDITQALDPVVEYAVLGFRELYGLELLQHALPELEEAISFRANAQAAT
jgi:hypothetical protein